MSEEALRAKIQEHGVSTQTVTNWSKGGRPIPVARYPLIASVIGYGLTVDELHGRVVREDSASFVVAKAQREDQFLANEIAQLPPQFKQVFTTLVELVVAQEKRDKAARAKAPDSRSKKAHHKGPHDKRPDA